MPIDRKQFLHPETKRIIKLAGFQMLVPGKRIPVVKVDKKDYTTKATIDSLIKSRPSVKTLVLCHGHTYPRRLYLPPPEEIFYVDINPVARPDILGDIRHTGFMANFPENYFDRVYLTYMPPPLPFHARNLNIYVNIKRLLKPGGELKSGYIYQMLARRPKMKKNDVIETIKKNGARWFTRTRVDRVIAVFVK